MRLKPDRETLNFIEIAKLSAKSALTLLGIDWLPQQIVHLMHGPKQLSDHIKNKNKEWLSTPIVLPVINPSSISDSELYLNACIAALNSDKDFSRFKSEKNYKSILEHTGYKFGRKYLKVLQERQFEIPREFLRQQTSLGDPEIFTFGQLGEISPSVFRYLKVVSDLEIHFPSWRTLPIVEVGVGYGGQLCALKTFGHKNDYLGIDLEIVATLAARYVEASGFRGGAEFLGFNRALPNFQGHIFISNFAFSELRPENQAFYMEKYAKPSSCGYVLWNRLSEWNLGGMTAEEFRKSVGGQILAEEPLTHPGNCLITWGEVFQEVQIS